MGVLEVLALILIVVLIAAGVAQVVRKVTSNRRDRW
jgi:hypothetical protein